MAWSSAGVADADYLYAFSTLVIPLLYEYRPELVVVAAGFDAGANDPLGGCKVTPECFAHMTVSRRQCVLSRCLHCLRFLFAAFVPPPKLPWIVQAMIKMAAFGHGNERTEILSIP